jgi:hypothetical protein
MGDMFDREGGCPGLGYASGVFDVRGGGLEFVEQGGEIAESCVRSLMFCCLLETCALLWNLRRSQ